MNDLENVVRRIVRDELRAMLGETVPRPTDAEAAPERLRLAIEAIEAEARARGIVAEMTVGELVARVWPGRARGISEHTRAGHALDKAGWTMWQRRRVPGGGRVYVYRRQAAEGGGGAA